jgi:mannonate dehydratase
MQQTWRWFGPSDPVTLADARQAGAEGIVSALHQFPSGEVWPVEAIRARQAEIADAGLTWSVVESVNISEAIKTGSPLCQAHLQAYIQTLANLAACGLHTVCYNFMPVLDWLRTDLAFPLPDGSLSMRFHEPTLAAFDLYVLERPGAEADWTDDEQRQARAIFEAMSPAELDRLTGIVLAGLPGTQGRYSLDYVRTAIAQYQQLGEAGLRANYRHFLRTVAPVAEELGMRLCVHPDDPPRSYLGLPRIVSTEADLAWVLDQSPEYANGITFCSGSLGVRADNRLGAMAERFAPRTHFVHLRATRREGSSGTAARSFHEAPHLAGDVDIVALMRIFVAEKRRRQLTEEPANIPFRADHGNRMLTDLDRDNVPGYPAVGRLKGLAELRGVLAAVESLV